MANMQELAKKHAPFLVGLINIISSEGTVLVCPQPWRVFITELALNSSVFLALFTSILESMLDCYRLQVHGGIIIGSEQVLQTLLATCDVAPVSSSDLLMMTRSFPALRDLLIAVRLPLPVLMQRFNLAPLFAAIVDRCNIIHLHPEKTNSSDASTIWTNITINEGYLIPNSESVFISKADTVSSFVFVMCVFVFLLYGCQIWIAGCITPHFVYA